MKEKWEIRMSITIRKDDDDDDSKAGTTVNSIEEGTLFIIERDDGDSLRAIAASITELGSVAFFRALTGLRQICADEVTP